MGFTDGINTQDFVVVAQTPLAPGASSPASTTMMSSASRTGSASSGVSSTGSVSRTGSTSRQATNPVVTADAAATTSAAQGGAERMVVGNGCAMGGLLVALAGVIGGGLLVLA